MADNNANISIDQDFYGSVRFFGAVEIKPTASFSLLKIDANNYISFEVNDFRIYVGGNNWYFTGSVMTAVGVTGAFQIGRKVATATDPAFTFNDDTNTGIGHANADELSLIAGGVEALRLRASGSFVVQVVDITGVSAPPTNTELEAVIGTTANSLYIATDPPNNRFYLLLRSNGAWRVLTFTDAI